MKKINILTLVILFLVSGVYGQIKSDKGVQIPMFTASYAFQIPQKDLKDRFGWNSNVGAEFLYKTKSNWLLGVEGSYLFSNNLKEDSVLDGLRSSNGEILNEYGEYADIILSERAYYVGAKFGKVFPVDVSRLFPALKPNKNSGLFATVSVGFLEHKIRFDNEGNNVAQLKGDYRKGYDRLTNGLSVKEFLGYMYVGENQSVNFFVGVEMYQSWTQNRRSYNFDTMEQDTRERRDDLLGFRVGWILPLYRNVESSYFTD